MKGIALFVAALVGVFIVQEMFPDRREWVFLVVFLIYGAYVIDGLERRVRSLTARIDELERLAKTSGADRDSEY